MRFILWPFLLLLSVELFAQPTPKVIEYPKEFSIEGPFQFIKDTLPKLNLKGKNVAIHCQDKHYADTVFFKFLSAYPVHYMSLRDDNYSGGVDLLKDLKQVTISGNVLSTKCWEDLSRLEKLTEMQMSHIHIDTTTFNPQTFKALKRLIIYAFDMELLQLSHWFRSLPNLEYFEINKVHRFCLSDLFKLLSGSKVKTISIAYGRFAEEAMPYTFIPTLTKLNIVQCDFKTCRKILKTMKNLKYFDVTGNGMKKEEFTALQKEFPNVKLTKGW